MLKRNIIPAVVLAAVMTVGSGTSEAGRTGVWTGVDFAPDSWYTYLGAVTALSGQDITTQDGWLLRGSVGYGEYDYQTTAVAGGEVDADTRAFDLTIGYANFFDRGSVKAYLGGDIINHDDSPDNPNSEVDGTQGGVKGLLELDLKPMDRVGLGAMGSYSTAFDTYWSRFTANYDFGAFALGPEVLFLGNEDYNQSRFGAAISGIDVGFANIRLYGGHASTRGRGDDGAYGGIAFGGDF
jgi:hypothetical protein